MKFCLYLKKNGIITAEQLVAALEVQHEKLTPIGQLAIEEQILSARGVFRVLRCQTDLPHERFGEVAVELGFMSHRELEQLLALQMSRKPPLIDVLVRLGALTAAQADEELTAYRQEMERHNIVVTRRIVSSPHARLPASEQTHADADYYAMMI